MNAYKSAMELDSAKKRNNIILFAGKFGMEIVLSKNKPDSIIIPYFIFYCMCRT